MKRNTFFFVFIFLATLFGYAQSPHLSIFDKLENRSGTGEGHVIIEQSDAIKRLVGTRTDSENAVVYNGKQYIETQGFNIKVFYDNNQRISKQKAEELKAKIIDLYPGIETSLTVDGPIWKLHVGCYLTIEEATIMRRELQKTFPELEKEIEVYQTTIRIPMN